MQDFFQAYFIEPILNDSGFNIVSTLTYAFAAIAMLYVLFKLFNKRVSFDFKFFLALVPFIFFGSATRAFMDHNYFGGSDLLKFLFYTPGIYLTTASLFFVVFGASLLVQKQKGYAYWKSCLFGGIAADVILVVTAFQELAFDDFVGVFGALVIFFAIAVGLFFAFKAFKLSSLLEKLPFLAICAHLFDAANTFVLTQFFGAWEKHPLPRFLIETLGPASFLVAKLAVVIPAVYFITKDVEDKQARNFILIAIAVLGFAEGLRNLLSLLFA